MFVVEVSDEIVVIDCGFVFLEDEMFGVDFVIFDILYFIKNREKVRVLIFIYGYEDYIGVILYVLWDLNVLIYGIKFIFGFVEIKFIEFGIDLNFVKLFIVRVGDVISFNNMCIEFIRIIYFIVDFVVVVIYILFGLIVYIGDFKVDFILIEGELIDLIRFVEFGK